jgi:hypothetical protein
LNTFDIFMWQPPSWPEPHPAVVVSHPDRARRKDWLEVVVCSSKRANRSAEVHEIILDAADGLDWPTLCRCDLVYSVRRDELTSLKGRVSNVRQAQLVRTLIAAHGWTEVLSRG